VVDAALFSYGRRIKVRQNYSEAVFVDIRVAVFVCLSIWFFFRVFSCFWCLLVVVWCCFLFFVVFGDLVLWVSLLFLGSLGIQILDSEV
jgi:hypothetical protein